MIEIRQQIQSLKEQNRLKKFNFYKNHVKTMREYSAEELQELSGQRKSSKLKSIRNLSATGPNVGNILDLNKYSKDELRFLENISISYNPLTKQDFSPLNQCLCIQKLRIDHTNLKEINLDFMRAQPVYKVSIEGNMIEGIDLMPLASCTGLVHLSIGFNNIKRIDLKPLIYLKNLRHLFLDGNQYTEIDLSPLKELCNLETLSFGSYREMKKFNLIPIYAHGHLEDLFYSTTAKNEMEELEPFINDRTKVYYLKQEYYYEGNPDGSLDYRCKGRGRKELEEKVWGEEIMEPEKELQIINDIRCRYREKKKED